MEKKDKILIGAGVGLIATTAFIAYLKRDALQDLITATQQELIELQNKNGMKKSFFTIEELCKSNKAKEKPVIDNTPPEHVKKNLQRLIDEVLDPARMIFGKAIHIESGYRCKELNTRVNGSKTSNHMQGLAADVYPTKKEDFPKLFEIFLGLNNYDQLIWEHPQDKLWIHVGLDPTRTRLEVKDYHKGVFTNIKNNWRDVVKIA